MSRLLILAFSILITTSFNCYSQDLTKNSVFAEVGGNAFLYSINYERRLNKQFVTRAGISFYSPNQTNYLMIPLTIGKYFGNGSHHIEIDGGLTYQRRVEFFKDYGFGSEDPEKSHSIFLTSFIGYRFHKPAGHFLFRAGITPTMEVFDSRLEAQNKIFLWGGLTFGYSF